MSWINGLRNITSLRREMLISGNHPNVNDINIIMKLYSQRNSKFVRWVIPCLMIQVFIILSLHASNEGTATVTLDNGSVTFQVPADFSPVSEEALAEKRKTQKELPEYILTNPAQDRFLAYGFKDRNLPAFRLKMAKNHMAKQLTANASEVNWVHNKMIELAGQQWGYLEFESVENEQAFHTVMLFTGYRGRILLLNYRSTQEAYPEYKNIIVESIESIRLQ